MIVGFAALIKIFLYTAECPKEKSDAKNFERPDYGR